MTQHSKAIDDDLRKTLLGLLPQLRAFARSLAGNRHDGDDLMQATVQRILERGLPDGLGARPWLFTICKNLFIDERRRHAVRVRASERPELREPSVSGEDVVFNELILREVDRAMAELPDEQRIVLALVTVQGMSYREAAEVTAVPIGTVMSRLARARAALARRLAPGDEREAASDV